MGGGGGSFAKTKDLGSRSTFFRDLRQKLRDIRLWVPKAPERRVPKRTRLGNALKKKEIMFHGVQNRIFSPAAGSNESIRD